MNQGYPISAVEAKNLYKNFLRGVTVARGFKTALYALDDDESVTRDQLVDDYGLMTTETWDKAFAIAEIERDALLRVEASEGLTGTPRIRISTIHAVKGQEADNVVLLPDLSYLTQKEFRKDPDNEHRVFYVGVTRARKNLYLHKPITDNFYKL